MKAKLKQLTGHGIEGLEHCPPLYHVDFEWEEFEAFLADPVGVMKDLGFEINYPRIVLNRWHEAWSEKERKWVRVDAAALKKQTLCCYGTDDEIICHRHG